MDSPSRNPLLLDQNNDPNTSGDDESSDEGPKTRMPGSSSTGQPAVKESYRRSPSTPTDRYNFAYIAFYILGM